MTNPPFDDRDGSIWFDGALVPWRDAKIHVLTHALHYASSVFEGERCYNGNIFKLTEHSERLKFSARTLGFDVPYTVEQIDTACDAVCKANDIVDGYVRPVAWRGSEMMSVAAQRTAIHLAIAAWPWPSYFAPEARMRGLNLTWAEWRRPDPASIPCKAKASGLYMICTLSKHAAASAGYDDALMLDWRGRVAECTAANIFFLFPDGRLHTPTPDCFLDGITRRTVIDLARRLGIEVVERAIMPDEIGKATEVFVTGSAAEVTPIGRIGDCGYTPASVTRALSDAYDKAVGKTVAVAA